MISLSERVVTRNVLIQLDLFFSSFTEIDDVLGEDCEHHLACRDSFVPVLILSPQNKMLVNDKPGIVLSVRRGPVGKIFN